jgi:glycosyltransferase involved in cell wall biosynthesis
MKISICVPTWNRFEHTINCFSRILADQRVGEVVINDDNSTDDSFLMLQEFYKDEPKVKLYKNNQRLKVHGNKYCSIAQADNDWCILFDSDNTIDTAYLDRIYQLDWKSNTIYQPSFAKPHFDYRSLCNIYNKNNIKEHIDKRMFDCMLNTQNFFVNRSEYLDTWEDEENINGADSIYFNYLWLQKGNSIEVVDGLEYDHLVHDGSFYVSVAQESEPKSLNLIQKIKQL